MSEGQRFYTDEEAQEILRLAAQQERPADGVTHASLLQTASELGISPEAVEAARRQWDEDRALRQDEQSFRLRQRRGFFSNLWSFVFVNAFLAAINLMTGSEYLWVLWVILPWALGLLFHIRSAFVVGSEDYQKEFARWRRRKNRAAKRESEEDIGSRPQVTIGVRIGGSKYVRGSAELDRIIAEAVEVNGEDSKLLVIKDVREATGMDLKDSKEAVDDYLDRAHGSDIHLQGS